MVLKFKEKRYPYSERVVDAAVGASIVPADHSSVWFVRDNDQIIAELPVRDWDLVTVLEGFLSDDD